AHRTDAAASQVATPMAERRTSMARSVGSTLDGIRADVLWPCSAAPRQGRQPCLAIGHSDASHGRTATLTPRVESTTSAVGWKRSKDLLSMRRRAAGTTSQQPQPFTLRDGLPSVDDAELAIDTDGAELHQRS